MGLIMIREGSFTPAVAAVQSINENRGCPVATKPADGITSIPTVDLTPTGRKQEYYFLLNKFLPPIIDITHEFRSQYPGGLVSYAPDRTT